ncbi:MAG: hypothetical protein IPP98_09730 [Gemmatimonadetes bacterium]|nr:hypothetical protein [Gemmatimonadota bacterium]
MAAHRFRRCCCRVSAMHRLGVPYKRMTVLAMAVDAPAPADSFAISDSVARVYLATEQRPMWQVDLASMGNSCVSASPPRRRRWAPRARC